jgi:hypothetical protein
MTTSETHSISGELGVMKKTSKHLYGPCKVYRLETTTSTDIKDAEKWFKEFAAKLEENVTILCTANILGCNIPAVMLFKWQRMKWEYPNSFPPWCVAEMTRRSGMKGLDFFNWLSYFSCQEFRDVCFSVFDGVTLHLVITMMEAIERHYIILSFETTTKYHLRTNLSLEHLSIIVANIALPRSRDFASFHWSVV